jgi:hypothetical protein
MNERKCIRNRARSKDCRAGGRSNAITQRVRSIRVRRFPSHSNSAARLANPKPAGDPKSFLKKNDVAGSDTWPVRTGTNPGYVVPRHPDFSLLKYRPPILGISDVGLEARVARMRGRIRGAERWNVAGRDDVHRNPDRSSRPAVLLYSSCSWLR